MTDKEKKEIQVKEKMEAATPEQTRPGAVFTPAVDIFETDADITLLADMPGVTSKDLTIDLRDNVLTLSGDIAPFENADEQDILIEYEVGKYYRQFTLSDIIDQSRIEA
ncbi:MAG: Hsp20/alpha crystallin family protein, partial [Thermodesulfobacteriota bacterium]|nr:Hsp20/alpha crystallin family protein [Thermodesulfobacteriota bacterium]